MKQVLDLLERLLSYDSTITQEQKDAQRKLYRAKIRLMQEDCNGDPEMVELSLIMLAGSLAELILKVKTNALQITNSTR